MLILETKSQINACENIRRVHQNIDRKLGRKRDHLVNVNNDWQEAAAQKLSSNNEVQRSLLAGALQELIRQKQRLEAEIRDLVNQRSEHQNDYYLRNCNAITGNIE